MEMPIREKGELAGAAVSPGAGTGGAKRDRLRIATAVCLSLTVMMAALLGVSAVIYGSGQAGNGKRDFLEYWAAGQLFAHGGNPYDYAATVRLERLGGADGNYDISLSPPLILWLVLPLGLVNIQAAAMLWMIFLLVSFAVSVRLQWVLSGRPGDHLYLLGFCFAPPIYCVMSGQIGAFLLLGIVLFLWLHESQPSFAGAALVLCTVKPHLFLPFALVVMLWVVYGRRYRVLAGYAAGLLAASATAFWFDPRAWVEWEQWLRVAKPADAMVPTLSGWFRFIVDRHANWLQFVPAGIASAWGAWYFYTRRRCWNWMEHGLLVLIVSEIFAPYAWVTDEALLLPALLAGAYRAQESGRSILPLVLIFGAGLGELLGGVGMSSQGFVWTGPAYLAWYVYATRGSGRRMRRVPIESPA